MPDYRVVADSEVQPDAPVTSSLGFALRDNPAAIAEGASGAPKVQSEALNLRAAASDRTSDGTLFTINSADRLSQFLVNSYIFTSGTAATSTSVRYRTSTDGGSSWGGFTVFDTTAQNGGANNRSSRNGLVSVGSNVNSIQFDVTSSGSGVVSASVSVLGIRGVSP